MTDKEFTQMIYNYLKGLKNLRGLDEAEEYMYEEAKKLVGGVIDAT